MGDGTVHSVEGRSVAPLISCHELKSGDDDDDNYDQGAASQPYPTKPSCSRSGLAVTSLPCPAFSSSSRYRATRRCAVLSPAMTM